VTVLKHTLAVSETLSCRKTAFVDAIHLLKTAQQFLPAETNAKFIKVERSGRSNVSASVLSLSC